MCFFFPYYVNVVARWRLLPGTICRRWGTEKYKRLGGEGRMDGVPPGEEGERGRGGRGGGGKRTKTRRIFGQNYRVWKLEKNTTNE